MGKSLPSATRLQEFAKVVSSKNLPTPKGSKSKTRVRVARPETSNSESVRISSELIKPKKMEPLVEKNRVPLAHVVSDCVKRWFQDTLKEANAGDTAMQALVGQMFCSGYGIPKDTKKGLAWINRASRARTSIGNVSEKHPGYVATDSESSEQRAK